MANDRLAASLHPARVLTTTADPRASAEIATSALTAEGFRVRSRPGSLPVVLEYGSAWNAFFFGPWFGVWPGPLGKHSSAVVTAEGDLLTISLVFGTRSRERVHRAITATMQRLQAEGMLLSDSGPLASDDLGAESPASPRGFKRLRRELTK